MNLIKKILNIDIKLTKQLANKLLSELQNKNINFEIISSYNIKNNQFLYSFKFLTSNIDQFLQEFNNIINKFDDKIDLRTYISQNTEDEIKKPIKLPGDFIVYPYEYNTYNHLNDKTIFINAGWAFGSGAHPSTVATVTEIIKLSLIVNITNYKVLDVGTGTGILAIILAKLGVNSILALDIDTEAIEQAKINIKINKLNNKIKLINNSLDNISKENFDLIVANLTPGVLCQLVPKIIHLANQNSYIIITSPTKKLDIPYIKAANLKKVTESNINNWYAFTYKKY